MEQPIEEYNNKYLWLDVPTYDVRQYFERFNFTSFDYEHFPVSSIKEFLSQYPDMKWRVLLYGTNNGNVVIREFPNMEKIAYIEVAKGKVINCVDISEDKNVIYAYAEVGQEIISIKDPRVMSEVDKLIIWHMGSAFN
jgi:hypothetical protein